MLIVEKIEIRFIKAEETYLLRHKVLRPNGTVQDCHFPMDFHKDGFHVGAVINQKIMGIASFHPELFPLHPAESAYRLRGMATDPEVQGQGLGQKVLQFGEQELKRRKIPWLWCNARQVAFKFYQNCGYSFDGDLFDIPNVGPHKVMYKRIN